MPLNHSRFLLSLLPSEIISKQNMSFSVDDLVSSLSSSHIGQEAIDLAALQAQLAATLFCGHGPSSTQKAQAKGFACPSPMRTPSTSFSMSTLSSIDTTMAGMMSTPMASRRGSCSVVAAPSGTPRGVSSPMSYHHQSLSSYEDAMDEDERMMVEELLIPSSPVMSTPSHLPSQPAYHHHQQQPATQPQSQASSYHPHSHSQYHSLEHAQSSGSSLFATTDPFYLAQLQASQNSQIQTSQNPFAQNGRMSQGSRFALSAF